LRCTDFRGGPLDAAGNSVKGQLVAQLLARELGLDIFDAGPAGATRLDPAD